MISELWIRRLGYLSCVALVLLSGAWVQAQTPPGDAPAGAPDSPEEAEEIDEHQHADDRSQGPPTSPYWLGVTCQPCDEVLRVHLHLDPGHGLVVANVAPGGPAAGLIERHDVLLMAGDQLLGDVHKLMEAVDRSGRDGEKLVIKLLRGGEEQTVEVQPQKREPNAEGPPHSPPPPGKIDELVRMLREQLGRQGLRISIPSAGFVVHDLFGNIELPDDVKITVEKHGKQPGKVIVVRGKDRWELSEEDLSKLPDELRGHAERMLGRMPPLPPDVLHWFGSPGAPLSGSVGFGPARAPATLPGGHAPPPGAPAPPAPPGAAPPPPGIPGGPPVAPFEMRGPAQANIEQLLDDRLQGLHDRLEQLQQAIDELRKEKQSADKSE